MQKLKIVLVLLIYTLVLGGYLFHKGYKMGWEGYKQSKNMELALESQYRFGILDGARTGSCEHESCYGQGFSDGWDAYYETQHRLTK